MYIRHHSFVGKRLRALLSLLVVCLALLAFSKPLYAATITIVDGDSTTLPTADTYTDGYIQEHLTITGSLTIATTDAVDDIRVEPNVEITWTTGSALSLIAHNNIVITGTIQHNGPADGSGGVYLVADSDGDQNGDVLIGDPSQPNAVAVGSRHGLTSVQAHNVTLQAGNGTNANYAQLGFRTLNEGEAYAVTGSIAVTATGSVTGLAGELEGNYVQVGHGGYNGDLDPDGDFSGSITISATQTIAFLAGSGDDAYAQVGHGGNNAQGNFSGDHILTSGGDISFEGGSGNSAYVQVGNGGNNADGNHSGNHTLTSDGNISFKGGDGFIAFAHMGNGGLDADGSLDTDGGHTGNHILNAALAISFTGGDANAAYAQVGNGGQDADNNHSGNHILTSGSNITFAGGNGAHANAQVGNGGGDADGNHSGDLQITSGGNLVVTGGSQEHAYAQVGHGGDAADGDHRGNVTISVTLAISFTGGTGDFAYAQAGHGGDGADGNHRGHLQLTSGGNIAFIRGSGEESIAQAGHGGLSAQGDREGNILLVAGDDLYAQSAQIGHTTTDGSITAGNTFIAVSQNNPLVTGSGSVHATGNSVFNSAPNENEGQLRFYAPRQSNIDMADGTLLNSEVYPGTVPADRIAGFLLFTNNPASHPYIPDVSFYFAPQSPALAVSKVASVEVANVGETIIYTYRITNSGDVPFNAITAIDDKLGTITLDRSSLEPGEIATGTATYTIQAADRPGPLVNTVTVTATPVTGAAVVVTATASVEIAPASFALNLPLIIHE
jgi:hypothetical protein